MKRKAFCVVVLMLLSHMASASNDFSQLTFQISTQSPTAFPMEPIPVTISLSNNTDSSIWACPAIRPDPANTTPNTGICEIFVRSEDSEFEFFPTADWICISNEKKSVELVPGFKRQVTGFLYFAQPTLPHSFDPNNFSKQHLLPAPGNYQIKAVLNSRDRPPGRIESNILTIKVLQPEGVNGLAYEYMKSVRKPYFLMRIFGQVGRGKKAYFVSAQEDFLERFPDSKYARYVKYSLGLTYTLEKGDYLTPGIKMLEQAADDEGFFLAKDALMRLVKISLQSDTVDKAQGYHNILKTRFPDSLENRATSHEIWNVLSNRKNQD